MKPISKPAKKKIIRAKGYGMRVAFVGNYLPRQCGIATFTKDLSNSIGEEIGNGAFRILAMNNIPEGYNYPQQVVFELQQNVVKDYRLAAEYINLSDRDIVSLQHEFGIYGGTEGSYINHFLANLEKPVVTTFHTVLTNPTPGYKRATREVANLSRALVVMSQHSVDTLINQYKIPACKIHHIHHGVPDIPFIDSNFYKSRFKVDGRFSILTFGLLSHNKGIEVMLDALPAVVEKHPEVIYIIAGATHPEVKKIHGEKYRISLERKVRDLGLSRNVLFHTKFLDLEELCELIGMADIVVTPYPFPDQTVSGTLGYAIGMGKAMISTPYTYAKEMLADGCGRLVDFNDSKEMAEAILELIEDEGGRHRMRMNAYALGRNMIWKEVGRRYVALFEEVISATDGLGAPLRWKARQSATLPEIKLDHLKLLTDNTGVIQHTSYGVPNRHHGYSSDDVARALVAALMYHNLFEDKDSLLLAKTYLSFLHYSQTKDGRFHNFMDYQRRFIDETGSEDTFGRVMWGLGAAVNISPNDALRAFAREVFENSVKAANNLTYPRAMAYTIIGLYEFLQHYPGASNMRRILKLLTERLVTFYREHSSDGWEWFEDTITYGNAKLPQAMLLAHKITRNKEYREIGLKSLGFLTGKQYQDGYFDIVGNNGWHQRDREKATFDQQPIDPAYLVETYTLAHAITGKEEYHKLAHIAFEWFLGRNRLGLPLYDFAAGACADGLNPHGINPNQGAESTICFLLALLTLAREEAHGTISERRKKARRSG